MQPFEVPSFGPLLDAETFKKRYLTDDPIPNFDINAVPSAGAGWKINVPERVEQLRTYLRENTYPAQQKNIIAVLEMYERKELPKPNTHRVCLQDGKVIDSTIDNWLKMEPIWTEVCLRQCTRIYLICNTRVTSGK